MTDIATAAQNLREEHDEYRLEDEDYGWCKRCHTKWPCPTIRVLDRLAELERENEIGEGQIFDLEQLLEGTQAALADAEWRAEQALASLAAAEARAERAEGERDGWKEAYDEAGVGEDEAHAVARTYRNATLRLNRELAQARAALEKLVADNTKRGMTSGALSWARLILKRQEPTKQ